MALARIATRLTTVQQLVNVGGDANDLGVTSPPRNFTTPDFNINCQQHKDGWGISIDLLRPAAEGDNSSYYLGAGLHRSDLMFFGGGLTHFVPGNGNREIYRVVSDRIANLSRLAEEEHCSDIRHAYQITLAAAEQAIRAARTAVRGQRHAKRDKAISAARAALVAASNHPTIAGIFRNCIDVHSNVNRLQFQTRMADLYRDTADMTQNRDSQGFHTFGLQRNHESRGLYSWLNYSRHLVPNAWMRNTLYGEDKDIRDMITPPAFRVPGPLSPVIVHL